MRIFQPFSSQICSVYRFNLTLIKTAHIIQPAETEVLSSVSSVAARQIVSRCVLGPVCDIT